jgi:hypothetical protein
MHAQFAFYKKGALLFWYLHGLDCELGLGVDLDVEEILVAQVLVPFGDSGVDGGNVHCDASAQSAKISIVDGDFATPTFEGAVHGARKRIDLELQNGVSDVRHILGCMGWGAAQEGQGKNNH